jgi:hypothetical protein
MPRVKSRMIAKHYVTPHPYDVVVYQEDGRYYAKDRKGNIVCRDSPTSCIQEAIDYINGGTIYIKPGTYIVKSPIIMKRGIKLIGASKMETIIYKSFTNSDDNNFLIDFNPNIQNAHWLIKDIYLRLESGHTGGGIRVRASRYGVIDSVNLVNFDSDSIRIEDGNAGTMTYDNVVQNCFIYTRGNGISVLSTDNYIRGNSIDSSIASPSNYAILISTGSVEVTENHVMSGGNTALIGLRNARFIRIINNFIDNGITGIHVVNSRDITILGNFFYLFKHTATYINNSKGIIIKGNIISYTSQEAYGYSDITLENNVSGVIVANNVFIPTRDRSRSAIRELSSDYDMFIENIIYSGYAVAPIEVSGANTINTNNIIL